MTQVIPQPADSPQVLSPSKSKRNPLLLIPIAIVIVGVGYAGWRFWPRPAATILQLSGRLEVDETDIGAKTGGRIVAITVREGDAVKVGQVVAQLEDEEIPEQLRAAAAAAAVAQQQAQEARVNIAVADSRIREATTTWKQSQGDASGRIEQATATVSSARANLAEAKAQVKQAEAQIKQSTAELRLARTDRDRYQQLVEQGAIQRQRFDQAQTTYETAQARLETAQASLQARRATVESAQNQLTAAIGGLTQAQSIALNPEIRNAQLVSYRQQRQQAAAKLAAAQAQVNNALATQKQLQRRLESLTIKSPIPGIVQDRPMEPGAVVATGRTLLTIIDPATVYLRGYVPAGDLSRVRVGQRARVLLDNQPNEPFNARVAQIDTKASFTPENIYFKQDRVKQVFGIKLAIERPGGFAKPGMPADAEIDLQSFN
jgi:HlyD family secretion protein